MKRLGIIALIVGALGAGFAGSMLHHSYMVDNARPVEAQQRANDGVRIALVNLEECARQSGAFKELKVQWEATQEDVKQQNEKLKREYDTVRAKIARAQVENLSEEEVLGLKVELKSIEEQQKVMQEEQKIYLSQMLNQYQKSVLELVMFEIEKYAKINQYDIVMQDYTVDTGDAAFFEGSAYAQALLAKPVLYAPGVVGNNNAYVTDITEVMIQRLRNVKLPKED